MEKTIKEQLTELAESEYRKFSSGLIPNINNVLGVRLPELRKLAKTIAKGDWRAYLEAAESDYFEEVMLQGMVIGCAKADADEMLRYIAAFVPKIDNWSVCDSFCLGLKFAKKNQAKVWDFLQIYLSSDKEYEIRFGVVMLLNFFVEETYIAAVLQRLDSIKHDGYYVKMAIAWAVAECYAKLPGPTMSFLESNSLDDFTFNKALQKITESYRVDPDTKALIRGMKRKLRREK
ncbi:DNA alkylation repair protein [Paenibacillus beijingensis]|uniref:DNA alkylation repair protein n=1 Tax=Paenibacillus beijingensis TaxID=1126833 RepID=A0A0D5NIC4_9BACL|nr:DNA alkylation repair protein [Paenibacillus beijingensis]AJY75114.1 DNA alkylation repair protein [Paenibacillus beijingensis]